VAVSLGSIAPVQFLNLRPFDQLLMLAGAGQSVAGCFGDSIAVITAAHYGCFTLRPAIAEARTLVCELPVLAGLRPSSSAVATSTTRLHLCLLGDFQSVVNLDTEVPDSAF
jgi:hypothetical protein